ncbi:MAG: hypothetical protein WCO65_03750 [bacterium]
MEKGTQFNADGLQKIITTFSLERKLNSELTYLFKLHRDMEKFKFGETSVANCSLATFKIDNGEREQQENYGVFEKVRFAFAIRFNEDNPSFEVVPNIEFEGKIWRLDFCLHDIESFATELPLMFLRKPYFSNNYSMIANGVEFNTPETCLFVKEQVQTYKLEMEKICKSVRGLLEPDVD